MNSIWLIENKHVKNVLLDRDPKDQTSLTTKTLITTEMVQILIGIHMITHSTVEVEIIMPIKIILILVESIITGIGSITGLIKIVIIVLARVTEIESTNFKMILY